MRRWIFAALVLANLAALLWGVQYLEQERPQPVVVQPSIYPEKMRLVKELAPNKLIARAKPSPPPPPVESVDVSTICFRMGPFTDLNAVQKVEGALADGPTFVRVTEASQAVSGYRVYLPSFKTKELAERRRRELTKLGFRDHVVMQEEGFHNAISLGLFSVEANAQSHVRQLMQKKVNARIQTIQQLQTLYWLDLAPVPASGEARARLGALLDGIAGVALYESACPPAATPPLPADMAAPAAPRER